MIGLAFVISVTCGTESELRVVEQDDVQTVRVEACLRDDTAAALSEGTVRSQQGRAILQFAVVRADNTPGPAMLGRYTFRNGLLRFEPRFKLTAGTNYVARLFVSPEKVVTVNYSTPMAKPSRPPHVEHVFPSAPVLPANNLKFYLHFSQPMRESRAIFDQIQLLNNDGTPVSDPWRRTELWSRDGKRFTLWIHPGRIKKGVNLREEFGPVLKAGRKYAILVPRDVRGQDGQRLTKQFRHRFVAGPADHASPNPGDWDVRTPKAGTREPLVVDCGESLDHALLHRCIDVVSANGRPIAGTITSYRNDTRFHFAPTKPWGKKKHLLVVSPILEDLAGNTPERVFDTDLAQDLSTPPQLNCEFTPAE